MVKDHYKKELSLDAVSSISNASQKDTLKIQSWLNLFAQRFPTSGAATGIDCDFGPATDKAVKNFQKSQGIAESGIVDAVLFSLMTKPLLAAFDATGTGATLRELIVSIANAHLAQHPFELVINHQSNSGPWVRSYMDGNEGVSWKWCMGFVQTIIDQAASQQGKDFRNLMPLSYGCAAIAEHAKSKHCFISNQDVRSNPARILPGDFFLRQEGGTWVHTGLIISITGSIFETIEGNTNTDGSSNGNGVYQRTRNFQKDTLDVFTIQSLV
jgi:hypothetical protein